MADKTMPRMIEGMSEETARKYKEFREKLDGKLIQIGNLGKTIYYASDSNAAEIELYALGSVGEVIYEMVSDLLCEMDEYISYSGVYLKLLEIDEPDRREVLPLCKKGGSK